MPLRLRRNALGLALGLALALDLSACFKDPGGRGGDGTTGSTSVASATTTCPIGQLGCPCDDSDCAPGLRCVAGSCQDVGGPGDSSGATTAGTTVGLGSSGAQTGDATGDATTGEDTTGAATSSPGTTEAKTTGGSVDPSGDTGDTGSDPTDGGGKPYHPCDKSDDCQPGEECLDSLIIIQCSTPCLTSADCPMSPGGTATPECVDSIPNIDGPHCILSCAGGKICPDGMMCLVQTYCVWM